MKGHFVFSAMVAVAAAATACQEKLATPSDCPELCPGTGLIVRDTILTALLGQDSTFTGYLSADQVGALLVSNGLAAGEARAFAVFPKRGDSVSVDTQLRPYTIDSVVFVLSLIARDTAVHDLRLILHRIPATVDTTTSFAELDGLLTPESLIDSVLVADTLKNGAVRVVLTPEELERIAPLEADSGRRGIGIRLNAAGPTGVRLGSANSGFNPPLFTTYVHADVSDTAKQRQQITLAPNLSNYVLQQPPPPGPDVLFLGGRSGSRVLLRFNLPAALKDSAAVVRATLELTPAGPLKGLPNDPGELQIRGVLVDLGAKSPALGSIAAVAALPAGATDIQSADLRSVVATWFGPNGATPTILLGLAPDGGTFSRPEFFSTLAPSGAPRLRLTYALPTRPGQP
ncbi:MAG TPA: hypothetical protein VGQ69_01355 [Gemmatimonadales bacterium]|nr:hypothetical protein [Gemmatimonadales bacterium]